MFRLESRARLRAAVKRVFAALLTVVLVATMTFVWPPTEAEAQQSQTVSVRVASGADDVEQQDDGWMYFDSSDLEFTTDNNRGVQTVGLRFTGVGVPAGATVTSASLTFMADESDSSATSLTVRGEGSGNASAFTNANGNLGQRPGTVASVAWSPGAWTTGNQYSTPDIASVVQEIVNNPGWAANNAMVMVISGSGQRVAESYEGWAAQAPLLTVAYTEAGEPPPPPPGGGVSVTAAVGALSAGESVAAPLVLDAGENVVGAIKLVVSYDVSAYTVSGCEASAGLLAACNVVSPGTVLFSGATTNADGLPSQIGALTVTANVAAPAASLDVAVTKVTGLDGLPLGGVDAAVVGFAVQRFAANEADGDDTWVLGDVNCDGLDIVDALIIAQLSVGNRTTVTLCEDYTDSPATTGLGYRGDINLDGTPNVVDALLVAQCDAGIDLHGYCNKTYRDCPEGICEVTLEPAFLGNLNIAAAASQASWSPIDGADTYEVQWFFDDDLFETDTDLATPAAAFDLAAQDGEIVCARIRGVAGVLTSEWSPRTCDEKGKPQPVSLAAPTGVVGESVTIGWNDHGADDAIATFYVDGEPVPATVNGAQAVVSITEDTHSVCAVIEAVDTESGFFSQPTSDCYSIHGGEIVEDQIVETFDNDGNLAEISGIEPAAHPSLPTHPDGSLRFLPDGSVEGSFTGADLVEYKCVEVPNVPMLAPGSRVADTVTGRYIEVVGYMWQPEGWKVAGTGSIQALVDDGYVIEASVLPVVGNLFSDVGRIEFADQASEPQGRAWGVVEVPNLGSFVPIIIETQIAFNRNWIVASDVRLSLIPAGQNPPAQTAAPCTVLSDISNFYTDSPSGLEMAIDQVRDKLEEACGGVWDCVVDLAEGLAQFAPGYDCFKAIEAIATGSTPSTGSVLGCAADGAFSAMAAWQVAGRVNLAIRNADDVPIGAIDFDGAQMADELKAAMDDAIATACSFSADTHVLMATGDTKPISDIEVGDHVVAADPTTGATSAQKVTAAFAHPDTLGLLTLRSGAEISTTSDHPFWTTTRNAWIAASELSTGDELRAADGSSVIVDSYIPGSGHAASYNFTVDVHHSYHVLAGETPILVHNACPFDPNDFMGNAAGDRDVYLGFADGSPQNPGDEIYTGITKDVEVREAQHAASDRNNVAALDPITDNYPTPTTPEARSIEQAIIHHNPQFENRINSISPTRPHYAQSVEWGREWIRANRPDLKYLIGE